MDTIRLTISESIKALEGQADAKILQVMLRLVAAVLQQHVRLQCRDFVLTQAFQG